MRILLRCACIVMLAAGLVACGGDDDETTEGPTPTSVTTVATGETTTPVNVSQAVTDGQPCSPQGSRGTTRDGLAMLCGDVGGDLRWRPA